jgi:ferritin
MTVIITDSLKTALHDQIGHELLNSHIYLYISAFLKNMGLDNLGSIFEGQYKEEQGHANLFVKILTDLGAPVIIPQIEIVNMPFGSIEDIAKAFYDREVLTTENIDELKGLAIDEDNSIVEEFLRSMIVKQQAEMDEAISFMDKAKLTGNDWKVVMLWDLSEGK